MLLPFLVDASTIHFVTPSEWGQHIFHHWVSNCASSDPRLINRILRFNRSIIAVSRKGSLNHTKTPQKHSLPLGRVLQQPFYRFGSTLGDAHCFTFTAF